MFVKDGFCQFWPFLSHWSLFKCNPIFQLKSLKAVCISSLYADKAVCTLTQQSVRWLSSLYQQSVWWLVFGEKSLYLWQSD